MTQDDVIVFKMADTEVSTSAPVSPSSSSSGVTKSVGSGDGVWLDAYHDPVASLYTFSTCVGQWVVTVYSI